MENFKLNTIESMGDQAAQPAPAPHEKPNEEQHQESEPKKRTDNEPGQKPAGV